MNSLFEFIRKYRIDHSVPLNPGLAFEALRHNLNTEMAFALGVGAGMTMVLM